VAVIFQLKRAQAGDAIFHSSPCFANVNVRIPTRRSNRTRSNRKEIEQVGEMGRAALHNATEHELVGDEMGGPRRHKRMSALRPNSRAHTQVSARKKTGQQMLRHRCWISATVVHNLVPVNAPKVQFVQIRC
jgi:hypothetical protein